MSNRIETTEGKLSKSKHRFSGQARFKMVVTAVVLPSLALLISSGGALIGSPHWQSGKASQYIAMLLGWPGYGAFLPLIAYSMVALMVWIWRDKMLRHFVVRLGLYTGVILTIQFLVFLVLVDSEAVWMLVSAAAVFGVGQAVVVFASVYIFRNAKRFSIRYLLIVTAIVAIAITLIKSYGDPESVLRACLVIPFVGAIASPILSTITMTRAAKQAWTLGQSKWTERSGVAVWEVFLGWLSWLSCYMVAWRVAVSVMLDQYSQLPVSRPGCYVASAAAHGHPCWVRSNWVEGISMPVNNQLRRLKFLEIVVRVAHPRLHRQARAIYDRLGPRLAKGCRRSRWLSDVAYFFLLVPEAIAILFRVLLRIPAKRVNGLYSSEFRNGK